MFVEPFVPFLLFVMAIYATPGPATITIAASGAAFGFRNTLRYILGLILGLELIFVLVAVGLGVLFSTYPTLQIGFKWLSFLYILYLAYRIATSKKSNVNEAGKPLSFLNGVSLCLVNPKAYFAVMATVAQFASEGESYIFSLVLLMIWVGVLAFLIDAAWAFAGAYLGTKAQATRTSQIANWALAVLLVISVLFIII